ncbi:MAG: zinc ribbon domain-containing protein [Burkholderiales bacterium]|nr:zinc ribbon domain-containing protein [Burkholderiales bacterium]MDE1928961.1 zinc ribbon domain-containing protein [Burkholderiales bacterium]MDE2501548.1 zinc ribbon domain-containing protein [Burkholderiales bacterium]
MPIYAYRCAGCGHAQDVLQKISDPVLTVCPACGAATYQKQVTAAGFQLKGSGWYVTDFRGGNSAPAKTEGQGDATAAEGGGAGDKAADKAADKSADKPADKPAAPAAAPAPASPAAAPPASSD